MEAALVGVVGTWREEEEVRMVAERGLASVEGTRLVQLAIAGEGPTVGLSLGRAAARNFGAPGCRGTCGGFRLGKPARCRR